MKLNRRGGLMLNISDLCLNCYTVLSVWSVEAELPYSDMNPEKLSWTTISTNKATIKTADFLILLKLNKPQKHCRALYYQFYEYCAYTCQDLEIQKEAIWSEKSITALRKYNYKVIKKNTTDLSSHQFYNVRDLDANRLALKKTCEVEDKLVQS